QAKANLQPPSDALKKVHHAGMSEQEHDSLLSSVAMNSSLAEHLYDVEAVEAQRKAYFDSAVQVREQIDHLRAQAKFFLSCIDREMKPLFDDGWRTLTSASAGITAFGHLYQETAALQKQRDELLLHFDID